MRHERAPDRPDTAAGRAAHDERPVTRVVIATSVAPRMQRLDPRGIDIGPDLQQRCVAAFAEQFGAVLAFNYSEEVAAVAADHPAATVIDVGPASASPFERPLVDIGAVFRHFARLTDVDVFGLANSDVLASFGPADAACAIDCARKGLVTFQRSETHDLASPAGPPYATGYDMFLFNRRVLEVVPMDGLCFGVPWWDYALPVMAMQAGITLFRGQPRFVRHYSHDVRWSREMWLAGLRAYLRNLQAQSEALAPPHPLMAPMMATLAMFGEEREIVPLDGPHLIDSFGTMFAICNVAAIGGAAITM